MNNQPSIIRGSIFAAIFVTLFVTISLEFVPDPVRAQIVYPTPTPTPDCVNTPTPTPSATQVPYNCPDCDSSPTPTVPPDETPIPQTYQGTGHGILAEQIYTPSPSPSPGVSPPGIVLIHGSNWNKGESHQIQGEARDLARAGYYVVSINYELTPCGYIPFQQCHDNDTQTPGWWVGRQADDVKAFITALRDSGKVDPNKIGIVGGSSGANLAAYIALDTTNNNGNWPFWNASARPACAVLLSGIYDLSDRTPPDGETAMDPQAIKDIENFAQTSNPATQKSLSPVAKVLALDTSTYAFVPMFLISSEFDPMVPHHQLDDMLCAIQSKGISSSLYQYMVIYHSNLHSFHYWQSCDELPYTVNCTEVRDDVIAFLDSYLK